MQLPYRLDRRAQPEPATALLLLTHEAAALLNLCGLLGHDPLPDVFHTRDGFLLILEAATSRHWPQTLRLRQLSEFLLLPVDADLSPQLHAEEAAALTRERGLIFLPGGRVLEFQPEAPVATTELLHAGAVRRDGWESLPELRSLARQIQSITLHLPHVDPEDLVEPGGAGIGTEDPRPDGAGIAETASNRARLGLGRALTGLGRVLGLDALRRIGERMIDRATEAVPRLAESVYGAQGAALRDLLRLFRSGDVEKALRRAIPRGEEGAYRGRLPGGARLPWHNLRYSLGNILGGRRAGPADVWTGHDDIFADLFREYHNAAQEAANRGDFRRAAFIYGKLLAEWRSAADVLARGGLHHDAAILYRDKLGDDLRAAEAFAAAGEFDEALAIYNRLRQHERAGDLHRRLGDEDAAIARYLLAAEEMMQTGRGPLRTGEFVLQKTQRSDLAETYFAAGWSMRNVSTLLGDAVPCATHLARLYAERDKPEPFLALLAETEAFFAAPGNAVAAGQLFNDLARQAAGPLLEAQRDEVRDRCLLALAAKLREHAACEERPGTIVSTLLGISGVWEAPVVRDASFALKSSLRQPQQAERSERPLGFIQLGAGTVTAARVAPHTGEVFVGFDNGLIVGFRATASRAQRVGKCDGSVAALATTLGGDMVVAASTAEELTTLRSFTRSGKGDYLSSGVRPVRATRAVGLAPLILQHRHENLVLMRHGPRPEQLSVFRGFDLLAARDFGPDLSDDWPIDLPLPKEVPHRRGAGIVVLQKGEARLCFLDLDRGNNVQVDLAGAGRVDWVPHLPAGSTLSKPPASWYQHTAEKLEVAGLDEENAVYWIDLRLSGKGVTVERVLAEPGREGYRAVMLIRPGFLVAVTMKNRLVWLRASADQLTDWAPSQALTSLSPVVAAFYCMPTLELMVLLANGYLVRVPVPS